MKILIVEDEIGIANFLKQGLEEEGYEVIVAHDGKSGLEKAQSLKVDIILLDWILPKMLGIDVCAAIRKEDSKTPILFLYIDGNRRLWPKGAIFARPGKLIVHIGPVQQPTQIEAQSPAKESVELDNF